MNGRLEDLRTASTQRLAAASQVLGKQGGKLQVSCYLVHVALECILKPRILSKARTNTIDALRRVMPAADFDALFFGRSGHALNGLAFHAALDRLLVRPGKRELLRGSGWTRMCGQDRPYSLRYGAESGLSRTEAEAELALGQAIHAEVEATL